MSFKRVGKRWFSCDDADATETQRIQAQVQQQLQIEEEFRRQSELSMRNAEDLQAQAMELQRADEINRQAMNSMQPFNVFGQSNF